MSAASWSNKQQSASIALVRRQLDSFITKAGRNNKPLASAQKGVWTQSPTRQATHWHGRGINATRPLQNGAGVCLPLLERRVKPYVKKPHATSRAGNEKHTACNKGAPKQAMQRHPIAQHNSMCLLCQIGEVINTRMWLQMTECTNSTKSPTRDAWSMQRQRSS